MGDGSVVIKFLYQRLKTWLTDTKFNVRHILQKFVRLCTVYIIYILLNMFGGCLIWQVKF